MKVGVIGAGTMGQGIAKAFAQCEGFTVALCDIKQEWAEGGKDKIAKGYAKLVAKGKLDPGARWTPSWQEPLPPTSRRIWPPTPTWSSRLPLRI